MREQRANALRLGEIAANDGDGEPVVRPRREALEQRIQDALLPSALVRGSHGALQAGMILRRERGGVERCYLERLEPLASVAGDSHSVQRDRRVRFDVL